MGFTCSDCRIDFSSVDEMDIYVLFQSGLFDIRVKSITAVDTPIYYPSPTIDIDSTDEMKALIDSAISSGGGLYDYGYMELCIAMYKSMLNTFLAARSDVISRSIRGMTCQGLQRAELQSKSNAAWTLRYTLDAILEELGFLDRNQATGWRPTTDGSFAYQCTGVTSGMSIAPITSEPTTTTDAPSNSPTLFASVVGTAAPTEKPTTTLSQSTTDAPTFGKPPTTCWNQQCNRPMYQLQKDLSSMGQLRVL